MLRIATEDWVAFIATEEGGVTKLVAPGDWEYATVAPGDRVASIATVEGGATK
jgi:hypothetical protein